MFASFDQERDFKTIEVLFRSNEGGMDVTDYSIVQASGTDRGGPGGGNNTIVSMDVDNAWVRSETFNNNIENTFMQLSATIDHEFSDNLWMTGLIGTSDSDGDRLNESTLMYDDRDYNGYSYSYSNPSDPYPSLSFNGPDVTDPTNFTLTELRDRPAQTDAGFDNVAFDLNWRISDGLVLSGGIDYKKASMDTEAFRRDGAACAPGPGGFDCDLDDDGTDDILGPQGTAANSEDYTYGGTVGAGSDTTWTSPSLAAWTSQLDFYNATARVDQGGTRSVEEKNTGVWLQLNGDTDLGDMRLDYNVGVRYVETEQSSSGYNSGVWVTVDRPKYDDTLPSANAALWVTDDFALRAAVAQVMSRPALGNLSPGGSVDSFNFGISFQNPNLDPTRADVFDLSAEWYFADEAVVALAFFSKDIESFPIRVSDTGTFASTGLPMSVISPTSPASQNPEGTCGNPQGCWEISQLGNGPGATLDGWEISFQAPFDSLFGTDAPFFSNLGVIANYTSIDSSFDFNFNGTTVTSSLIGQSDSSYNATVYYENDVFGARVSVANRSSYNESGPDRSDNLWQYLDDATYVDFAAKYIVNDNLTLTFEMLNLTDEESDFFVDTDAQRRLESYQTGTNILLGMRYAFD
jgi:TonB-dependent receptor